MFVNQLQTSAGSSAGIDQLITKKENNAKILLWSYTAPKVVVQNGEKTAWKVLFFRLCAPSSPLSYM